MNKEERELIPRAAVNANKEKGWAPTIIGPSEARKLAYSFSPELREIWDELRWISQSDLARLLYVYENGGAYFDSDCWVMLDFRDEAKTNLILFVECKVNVQQLGPREKKTPERATRIANYAFSSPREKHQFFADAINEAIRRLKSFPRGLEDDDVIWSTGPDVITSLFHDNKSMYPDLLLLPPEYLKHTCTGTWKS
jgi:hypothetical protein